MVGVSGSQGFTWWHYDVIELIIIKLDCDYVVWLCFVHISGHFLMGNSSCSFQQGDNIVITSWTYRHCTLIIIMCSDSYPIAILSLFFLYHPYIPLLFILKNVLFYNHLPFLPHAGMLTRCTIVTAIWPPSPIWHINRSKRHPM